MDEKELLKQCKKEINKINKICKKAPSIDIVSKESQVLSTYTDYLQIEKLTADLSAQDLNIEYKKCMKLKEKAEKIFMKAKSIEYSMATSIQELKTSYGNIERYLKEIENLEQTQDLSTMGAVLNQNLLIISKWIEEEMKLIDSLKVNVNIGVNLFREYISKIVQLQKERLK